MTKARTLADNFAADINGITAGTGITGGGTSGTVTITNDMATAINAKGDLVVGTGADAYARLAVASTAGYLLSVDSAEATGLKWAAPAGGNTMPAFRAQPTSGQVISANTWTKVTLGTEIFDTNNKFANSTFTPTVAGYYIFNNHYVMEGGNQVFQTAIYKNGTIYDDLYWGTSGYPGRAQTTIMYLDADDYVEMYVKTDLGNQVLNTASYFAGLGVRE